ncbi:MAG: glycosyltransferase family 39 protein [Solirubrobacteraceae bacterium]
MHGDHARRSRLALAGVIGLAAANFLWQLGSSSYFVDEVLSVSAATVPLGDVLPNVSRSELTPPGYFYLLHEWTYRLGSHAEWLTRLPSAICGVLLVGAVYWLARLVAGSWAVALGGAALTAVSPFVLEYAQRAQGYVFVMLAVTVAVACALAAERSDRRRTAWLITGAAAAVISLWVHYTAAFVVVVLCGWVATRRTLPIRARAAFVGTCSLAGAALVPVLVAQHRAIPVRTGVAASAGLAAVNVQRLLETPFDGRVDALGVLGMLLTVGAVVLVAVLVRRRAVTREWRLLLLLAAGEPLTLLLASAFGAHLALTRYAAVSAPFMIVVIATALAAIVRLARPRYLGTVLAAVAATSLAAVALTGLLASHQTRGFYLDARGVVAYLTGHTLGRDAVLAPSSPAIAVPLIYYGISRLHPAATSEAAVAELLAQHTRRIWTILALPAGDHPTSAQLLASLARPARALGYRAVSARVFPGVSTLAVVLETPVS